MKRIIYILLSAGLLTLICLLSSCGSVKSVVKSDTKVKQVTTIQADSTSVKVVNTKTYGDSLKGNAFVPIDTAKADTDQTDTVTVQSAGISLQVVAKPKRNQRGGITGEEFTYNAIAKPTTTTDTHETAAANVRTTIVKDSAAKVDSTTKKTIGFGLPSWVWWVVGIIALLALIYFIKPFLNLLKLI